MIAAGPALGLARRTVAAPAPGDASPRRRLMGLLWWLAWGAYLTLLPLDLAFGGAVDWGRDGAYAALAAAGWWLARRRPKLGASLYLLGLYPLAAWPALAGTPAGHFELGLLGSGTLTALPALGLAGLWGPWGAATGLALGLASGEALGLASTVNPLYRAADVYLLGLAGLAGIGLRGFARRAEADHLALVAAREEAFGLAEAAGEAATRAEAIAAVSRLVGADFEPEEIAAKAALAVARVVGLDWCGLTTASGDAALARTVWGREAVSPEFERLLAKGSRRGQGVVWSAFDGGGAVYVDDYAAHEHAHPSAAAGGVGSVAVVPLAFAEGGDDGRTRFALVGARLGRAAPWSPADRELLEAAGRGVGVALERRARLRWLETAALRDPLTGLGNRRAFEEELPAELARAARHGLPLGVLSLDLDGLKGVNDTEGHERGDALLREFAVALGGRLRAEDRLYRLGGDEFVALLPGVDPRGARAVLERVGTAVEAVREAGFTAAGASAGLAAYPAEADTADALVRLSDERMYETKLLHRGARAALERPERPEGGSRRVTPAQPAGRRLLVVEDNAATLRLLRDALGTEGYLIDTAASASEAERLASATAYDLLVSDVSLPEGPDAGLRLVAALRVGGLAAPVLFLTARAGAEDRVAGLESGGDDYLTKPFHLGELRARLRALLRRA